MFVLYPNYSKQFLVYINQFLLEDHLYFYNIYAYIEISYQLKENKEETPKFSLPQITTLKSLSIAYQNLCN